MKHADLLKLLLPPEAFDPNARGVGGELQAEGAALDEALAQALALLEESDPGAAAALLPDWERVAGLPDPCVGTAPQSTGQRRAALVGRLTMYGGQSAAYYIGLAERYGYPGATVTEFRPATCNSDCNAAVFQEDWRPVWRLNLPQDTGVFHASCNSNCNDPLQSWGDAALECTVRRFKPADTHVLFSYGNGA